MPYPITPLSADQRDTALDMAHQGDTFKEIAEKLGITPGTLLRRRREDPTFARMLDDAMLDGSAMVLEQIKTVPFTEENAQRARVQIDALCRYLELRWPSRYGKQVNVNLKVLDMRSAIDKARQRASQVIDLYKDSTGTYTDMQSVDTGQDAINTAVSAVTCFDDLI